MKSIIEFRTSALRKFLNGIEPDAKAQLILALDEIDAGKLTKKVIDESADSIIIAWDIYVLGLNGRDLGFYSLFKDNCIEESIENIEPSTAMRKLKWEHPVTKQAISKLSAELVKLHASPVGTAAVFVIGRTTHSQRFLSLFWHHPDLWESDAVKLLKSFGSYSQSDLSGTT